MTIFSKIIRKEIDAYIVYEDDLVIAFLDIMQSTKGHTLVVTKNEYKDLFEVPELELAHLIKVTKKIASAIKKSLNPLGVNLVNNNGEAAGQTVMHYHMHIIPRYNNDSFNINYTNNMSNTSVDDYKKRANLIKSALS